MAQTTPDWLRASTIYCVYVRSYSAEGTLRKVEAAHLSCGDGKPAWNDGFALFHQRLPCRCPGIWHDGRLSKPVRGFACPRHAVYT